MIPWKPRSSDESPPDGDGSAQPRGRDWLRVHNWRSWNWRNWREWNWRRLHPRHINWRRVGKWSRLAFLVLLLAATGWATWVAPPWGPMQPPQPPTFTFLAADGTPIARRGGRDAPVDAAKLPLQVRGAFIAIEDRRFRSHNGIDPRGLLRASWRNFRAGGVVEGGSTITQQLAKNAFLSSDRRLGRKVQEIILAIWLDAWLSKDEILSRYLSTIYFGDGSYGLRAAARHYFQKTPETLNIAEAAMLAGMVKAPSRLNPVANLGAAQARSKLVLQAMAEEGMIAPAQLSDIRLALPDVASDELPGGTYFVDWVAPQAEEATAAVGGQIAVSTTLDLRLQKAAIKALTSILSSQGKAVHATQAALVAMRPDGRVVAMIGGRSYKSSPFNRATQANRQPGSAFKLAVYLAALEQGYTPDTPVENGPLTVDGWTPRNYGERYGGTISLRSAFAQSSNVAAVRIAEQVGRDTVTDVARKLGITAPITPGPSLALGSSGVSLLELTAAYAAIAGGHYPVKPRGLPDFGDPVSSGIYGRSLDEKTREDMLDLLWTATNQGTGRAAALAIPTFGKTGTTQNYRDAIFVGFAGGLVTGIWVGNDDDTPMKRVTGGTLPAQIWRSFMRQADLRAGDLRLPPTLMASIAARQEAMRVAAEIRELESLEAAEAEEASPFERFFRPLIPGFLRGDQDDERRQRIEELRQRQEERRRRREAPDDPYYEGEDPRWPRDEQARDEGYWER